MGTKHTYFTICTPTNLKKLKRFLNITEYRIFLIKSFNGSECGIGIDCPEDAKAPKPVLKWSSIAERSCPREFDIPS